ncbi:MAG: class III extradiol dioxygenase subunit B-like domain-containing protein [bacterium]
MIVSAHLLPHSPLLLPSIGKERTESLKNTVQAISIAADEIRKAKPDTIIVISSHGTVYKDAFSANIHDIYQAHFEEFGDFATSFTAKPDLETADRLSRHLNLAGISYKQSSDETLDYGTAVSLSFLTPLFAKTRLISLSPSQLDAKSHFDVGMHISEILLASKKRFSIICSGDLSQRLTTQSPAGYSADGAEFESKLKESIVSHNVMGLLKLAPELVNNAGECSYRPLLMMLGIIEAFPYQTKLLSYEAPFGVGELVASFELGHK